MKNKTHVKNHEDVPQVPSEDLFKKELTRVHKGQYAPAGKIFLVVTCKDKINSYKKAFPILFGTPEDRIDEMATALYLQIKKQYSL